MSAGARLVADMTQTPSKIVYTARATATGGRQGRSTSEDGILDVSLTAPKEMGGPGTGTNPEQLFAAGYAACFQGAMGLAAKKAGVDTSSSQVTAEVGIGPEGDSYGLTVDLKVAIPGVDLDTAQQLADAAHQLCPYSKATRGNVPVTVTAVQA
jgi:Ohr subfamily peroxiredoxin